ncbi:hypothetical protein OHJ16_06175 [Actinomyces israelii]|uniref:Uncharacterized protein n=1 Tax=Actinomyces israelii TaxID=1659 RepID=A0ABT4I984_9ACTO|nr:hypothetical protein [Actinomyces israelii]MCZ0857628.1 hypothetical protein [Actinomyces israelii]
MSSSAILLRRQLSETRVRDGKCFRSHEIGSASGRQPGSVVLTTLR